MSLSLGTCRSGPQGLRLSLCLSPLALMLPFSGEGHPRSCPPASQTCTLPAPLTPAPAPLCRVALRCLLDQVLSIFCLCFYFFPPLAFAGLGCLTLSLLDEGKASPLPSLPQPHPCSFSSSLQPLTLSLSCWKPFHGSPLPWEQVRPLHQNSRAFQVSPASPAAFPALSSLLPPDNYSSPSATHFSLHLHPFACAVPTQAVPCRENAVHECRDFIWLVPQCPCRTLDSAWRAVGG